MMETETGSKDASKKLLYASTQAAITVQSAFYKTGIFLQGQAYVLSHPLKWLQNNAFKTISISAFLKIDCAHVRILKTASLL